MTTEEIFTALRELQDVLIKKIQLENEILEIPKSLSTQEELVKRLKENYVEKDKSYVAVRKQEGEIREQLITAEGDREKAEKKMDAIETQREYEALDKEIKDAANREHNFRRELQLSEQKIAALKADLQQNKELMDQQEAELIEKKHSVENEIAECKKELDKILKNEKNLTRDMDNELVFKFERIVRKKGGRGIVAVKGGVCNSCHMILPIQFATSVRLGKEVLSCPYCSSVLYYEESAEGEEDFFDDASAGALSDLDDIEDEDEYDDDEESEEYDEKANAAYEEE